MDEAFITKFLFCNLKKVLTLVLTVAMLLSIMVVGTGAAFSDQSSIKNTEAVDVAVALNIIDGMEDGSYRPANNVTRAQMCKMICVALNGGKEPTLGTNATPTFSDVRTDPSSSWAESFIESCNSQGIVSGVGGGRFNPSGNVTGTQAARMLLVALGFNATNEGFTGDSWDINVNVRATQKGLYKDIESIDPNAALTRDNAAQMIKNALDAIMVSYNNEFTTGANGQLIATPVLADKVSQNGQGITLLMDKYDGYTVEGILNDFNYDSNKAEWTYTVKGVTVKSSTDYTDLLGQNVEVIYDNGINTGAIKPAYGIYASDSTVLLTGVVGNLPALKDTDTSFRVDGTTYRLESGYQVVTTDKNGDPVLDSDGNYTYTAVGGTVANAPVYAFTPNMLPYTSGNLNALAGKDSSSNDITKYDAQRFAAIDQDGNGRIDCFMIYPVTVTKVTALTSSKVTLGTGASQVVIDREDASIYDGIAKDDWVVYTAENNTANSTAVIAKADLLSGKVTRVSGKVDLTVDGSVYTIDDSYFSDADGSANKVGATLKDAVIYNGYIFGVSTVNAASANAEDYIVALSDPEQSFGTWRARVMMYDGSKATKITIDLDEITFANGTTVTDLSTLSDGDLEGKIFTYTTNSSDEYTLTEKAITGTAPQVEKINKSSSKVGYIGSDSISDDAVIFVNYDNSDKYDIISGATMKTMNVTHKVTVSGVETDKNYWTVKFVQSDSNASTGVGSVNVAYVVYDKDSLSVSDTYYGYITAVTEVSNSDNKDVKEFALWTKDAKDGDPVAVTTTTSLATGDAAGLTKGDVISYTLNSDGVMDSVKKITTTGTVTARGEASVSIDGSRYDLSSDTIILGVDIDNPGTTDSCNSNGSWSNLTKDDKVYYVLDSDNEKFELIVYSVNGKIS